MSTKAVGNREGRQGNECGGDRVLQVVAEGRDEDGELLPRTHRRQQPASQPQAEGRLHAPPLLHATRTDAVRAGFEIGITIMMFVMLTTMMTMLTMAMVTMMNVDVD